MIRFGISVGGLNSTVGLVDSLLGQRRIARALNELNELWTSIRLRLAPDVTGQGASEEVLDVQCQRSEGDQSAAAGHFPARGEVDDDHVQELFFGGRDRMGDQVDVRLEDPGEFGAAVNFAPQLAVLIGEFEEITDLARTDVALQGDAPVDQATHNARTLENREPLVVNPGE